MSTLGFTIQTIGEVMIGITILYVHHKMLREKKFDKKVFADIRIEQWTGLIGIIMIIFGYIIQITN
ncbi:MAG: hypothetical protein ABIA83_03550 [Patescibacteria group bacterium]